MTEKIIENNIQSYTAFLFNNDKKIFRPADNRYIEFSNSATIANKFIGCKVFVVRNKYDILEIGEVKKVFSNNNKDFYSTFDINKNNNISKYLLNKIPNLLPSITYKVKSSFIDKNCEIINDIENTSIRLVKPPKYK